MAQIYRIKMTTTIEFDLKADDRDQAQEWIDERTTEDIVRMTKRYDEDNKSEIVYEYSNSYDDEDIDISTEEDEEDDEQ